MWLLRRDAISPASIACSMARMLSRMTSTGASCYGHVTMGSARHVRGAPVVAG
jgi:hypothetical protein